jgi:hypothetical protein
MLMRVQADTWMQVRSRADGRRAGPPGEGGTGAQGRPDEPGQEVALPGDDIQQQQGPAGPVPAVVWTLISPRVVEMVGSAQLGRLT